VLVSKLATSFVSSIHREMLPNLILHSPGHQVYEHAGLMWYYNSVLQ